MPQVDINYWAVLVAGVVNIAIGFVWYAKGVFGTKWAQDLGKNLDEMGKDKKAQMRAMPIMVVGSFLMPYILAHFVGYTNTTDWVGGVVTALWAFVGFSLTMGAMNYAFAQKKLRLFLIEYGNILVSMVVAGAILGGWR
jgi:hypothetical protein